MILSKQIIKIKDEPQRYAVKVHFSFNFGRKEFKIAPMFFLNCFFYPSSLCTQNPNQPYRQPVTADSWGMCSLNCTEKKKNNPLNGNCWKQNMPIAIIVSFLVFWRTLHMLCHIYLTVVRRFRVADRLPTNEMESTYKPCFQHVSAAYLKK